MFSRTKTNWGLRATWIGLLVAWTLGQILVQWLFDRHGFIQYGVDSGSYLAASRSFPNDLGSLSGYSGYVALLALGDVFGSSEWFIVVIQNAAVLLGAWCISDLARLLGYKIAGRFLAYSLLVNPLFAQWFRYVLTETLFISSIVILVWSLAQCEHRRHYWLAGSLVGSLLIATLRPNGFLLAASAISFLIWLKLVAQRKTVRTITSSLPWLLIAILLLTFPGLQQIHGSENSFAKRTLAGEVFWNDSPTAITMPDPKGPVVDNSSLATYALKNPVPVARLYSTRLVYEMIQIRPWYSPQLNVFALVSTVVLLCLAVTGLHLKKGSPIRTATLMTIIPQALLICLTWATPEGRFGWWLLAPLTVFAACGAGSIAGRVLVIVTESSRRTPQGSKRIESS